jgi:hypothetical protein
MRLNLSHICHVDAGAMGSGDTESAPCTSVHVADEYRANVGMGLG